MGASPDDTDVKTSMRSTSHVVHETKEARNWTRFPPDAIAIASDGSGNHVILRAGSSSFEIWDHETGECTSVTIDWAQNL